MEQERRIGRWRASHRAGARETASSEHGGRETGTRPKRHDQRENVSAHSHTTHARSRVFYNMASSALGAFPPTAKRGPQNPADRRAVAQTGHDWTTAQTLEALGFPADFSPADAADDLAVATFIDNMPDSFLDKSRAKMTSILAWAHALFATSTPATRDIGKFSPRGLSFLEIADATRKLAPFLAHGKSVSDLIECVGQVRSQSRVALLFLSRVIVVDALLAANVGAVKPSLRGPDAPVGDMSFAEVVCAAVREVAPELFGDRSSGSPPPHVDSETDESGRKEAKERKRDASARSATSANANMTTTATIPRAPAADRVMRGLPTPRTNRIPTFSASTRTTMGSRQPSCTSLGSPNTPARREHKSLRFWRRGSRMFTTSTTSRRSRQLSPRWRVVTASRRAATPTRGR